jgi:hypothetical protein
MVALSDGSKYCRSCGIPKPVGEFRRRSRDGEARLNQCRTCHREAERCRRAVKAAKRDGKTIDEFAAQAKRAKAAPDVGDCLGHLYRRFGGLDGFIKAFYSHYLDTKPGGAGRTRMFEAIIRLTELNSDARDKVRSAKSEDEIQYYTDDELEFEFQKRVVEFLCSSPDVAVAVVEALGYTVTPPGAVGPEGG